MSEAHDKNRACWNAWAAWWCEQADERGTWRECHRNPDLVLSDLEMESLGNVRGRDVCVLASGDNEVVFALAGLGARVTSVDISEGQLEIARGRAEVLGLEVRFVRADVTDLAAIADASFDVVYTGGHVSVWIDRIARYYAEGARILRPGGTFVVNDYHPVRRMFLESEDGSPSYRYFDRGPHVYPTNEGLEQVEFHWTTADHVQAMIDAGCVLTRVEEHGEGSEEDFPEAANTPAGLPMWLMLVGRKAVPAGP